MSERSTQLGAWYAKVSGISAPEMVLAAGDASFRKYYRAQGPGGRSVILCDAPPETEKNAEFVRVARALAEAGVRVPQVLDADVGRGFLALEDLGDQTLLPRLKWETVGTAYADALGMLEILAAMDPCQLGLPGYDYPALAGEMALFPEWFCDGLLGMPLEGEARDLYDALERALCERARDQRQVVVHRDFHARNLMVLDDGKLATIDFQDAVIGPVTYDPVSLLRDCYLRWPAGDVRRWALMHRENLRRRGIAMPAPDAFLKDFDWMGLQRHIKVLGIFARLYQRDGKPGYLPDLPRVLAYVREVLAAYPGDAALADFARWFDEAVMPRASAQPWYRDLGDLPA